MSIKAEQILLFDPGVVQLATSIAIITLQVRQHIIKSILIFLIYSIPGFVETKFSLAVISAIFMLAAQSALGAEATGATEQSDWGHPGNCEKICWLHKPNCGSGHYAYKTGNCWTCCRDNGYHGHGY